jgi:hypothetical protein
LINYLRIHLTGMKRIFTLSLAFAFLGGLQLTGQNLGVNESSPTSRLSVRGGVAIGSAAYTQYVSPPSDGLILSGNAGFGRPDPQVQVDVAQNQAVRVGNALLSSGGDFMHLANNAWFNGTSWQSTGGAGAILQFSGTTTTFFRHNGAGTLTSSVVIDGNGRVGIGSTGPVARLEVVADGVAAYTGSAHSAILRTVGTALSNVAGSETILASFGARTTNESSLGVRLFRNTNGSDWTTSAVLLEMDVDNTARVNNSYISLAAGGNVGIGIANPAAKLHVTGNLRADGDVRANTGDVFSSDEFYSNQAIGVGTFLYIQGGGAANRNVLRTDGNNGYLWPWGPGTAFPTVSVGGGATTNLAVSGTLSKGAGTFKIDHPQDPENKYLIHSFVESPDMLNIYNGIVTLDANGAATVQLPDYFMVLNRDFRYTLTPLGAPAPNLYIAREVTEGSFAIAGGQPGQRISWQVTGIRQDPYARRYPIVPVVEKRPEERGYYLHPELYGQPPTRAMIYGWGRGSRFPEDAQPMPTAEGSR